MLKRIFDFCLAVFGLLIFSPLWVLLAWAIWLCDGRPVLFSQERIGRFSKPFMNLKFRSMIKDAEKYTGPIQALHNDSRITRVGKFMRKTALDELPQLINIALGQMSFVGPRPLRPCEIQVSGAHSESVTHSALFNRRCRILPGLTGVAQVYAARDIPVEEKLKFDLWYSKHQYFCLDIYLIFKSVANSVSQKWDSCSKRIAR